MHQIGSLISFSATICAGKAVQEALRNRPDPKSGNPLSLYQLGNYFKKYLTAVQERFYTTKIDRAYFNIN
ncbi:MAG TPA: hypothetical protein PLZ66_05705 [Rectinema sp.]|nr:hypothetical protein [Rectinema sp.]HRU78061.1 hypothetical protein [Rectinema sp.]